MYMNVYLVEDLIFELLFVLDVILSPKRLPSKFSDPAAVGAGNRLKVIMLVGIKESDFINNIFDLFIYMNLRHISCVL